MNVQQLIEFMVFLMNVKEDIMLKYGNYLLNVLIVYQ
jgi:hypothetical protein